MQTRVGVFWCKLWWMVTRVLEEDGFGSLVSLYRYLYPWLLDTWRAAEVEGPRL